MLNTRTIARNMALTGAFSLLLGTSAFAQPRIDHNVYERTAGYTNRTVEGTVAAVVRDRDGARVRLTDGFDVFVPRSVAWDYQGRRGQANLLLPGDVVRLDVYSRKGDGRAAEVRSMQILSRYRDRNDRNDRYDRNNAGVRRLTGTVISLDRRANVMVMQTDNGRTITVDLRNYDGGQRGSSRFRRGDRVSVSGRMDRGGFLADDVRVDNQRNR